MAMPVPRPQSEHECFQHTRMTKPPAERPSGLGSFTCSLTKVWNRLDALRHACCPLVLALAIGRPGAHVSITRLGTAEAKCSLR